MNLSFRFWRYALNLRVEEVKTKFLNTLNNLGRKGGLSYTMKTTQTINVEKWKHARLTTTIEGNKR